MSLIDRPTSPGLQPNVNSGRRRFPGARTVFALMLREMATTYGRSPGGYIWAVLEPAAGIVLLTLIFSLAFRSPPLGVNFPIFYASGLVPFSLFLAVSSKMAMTLVFSKPLLTYPTVTFVDALTARFLVNMITQLMVAYVIFTAILLTFDTRTILDLPKILLSLTMAGLFASAVGIINCFLFFRFPVYKQVWSIINRPLFIISCIFFTFESVPQPYRDYLWYNPFVHIIGISRSGFYASYRAEYVSMAYVFGISLVLMFLGLMLLRRYYRDLIEQ